MFISHDFQIPGTKEGKESKTPLSQYKQKTNNVITILISQTPSNHNLSQDILLVVTP